MTFPISSLSVITLTLLLFSCESPSDPSTTKHTDNESITKEKKSNSNKKNAVVSLNFGGLSIAVDASVGGRLAALDFNGTSMIKTTRDAENLHWGSTVWPSPQSQWNWPPPATMDHGEYEIKIQEPKMLLLESPPNAYLGITVKKRYHLRDPRTLDITYQFFNEKDTTIKVGIWENSRVDYEGQIAWATDKNLKESTSNMSEVADETRLELKGQTEKQKLFINSDKGWVAYRKNGIELKKTFPIIEQKDIAKDQAQIEIYLDPIDRFAEIEQHGAFEELGPGAVATFRVRWNLSEYH